VYCLFSICRDFILGFRSCFSIPLRERVHHLQQLSWFPAASSLVTFRFYPVLNDFSPAAGSCFDYTIADVPSTFSCFALPASRLRSAGDSFEIQAFYGGRLLNSYGEKFSCFVLFLRTVSGSACVRVNSHPVSFQLQDFPLAG